MESLAWYVDSSVGKVGRVWSAMRDESGVGRPPWTHGSVTTQLAFDNDTEQNDPNRQYIFLPLDDPGPGRKWL